MTRRAATLALTLCTLTLLTPAARAAEIYPQFPSLTPDGRFVVFSWAGDLWSVPAEGGAATRLTSHAAEELRSAVSPGGDLLAFTSNREGAANIYVADLEVVGSTLVAGAPRRVTVSDDAHNLTAFSPDGAEVLFSSYQDRDIYREEKMYAAPLDGGPARLLTEAFGEHPVMTREGDGLVFARGSNNKVRPTYRGPATGEIWTLDFESGVFDRLTTDDADDIEPSPLPDGSVLFISSADGQYNLWKKSPGAFQGEQLTSFKPGPRQHTIAHGVRDLGVSWDGATAVFAVWDTLYTLDLTRDNARPRAIGLTIAGDTDALDHTRMDLDREATEVAISPDGQTVAIVARGEIFVRATAEDRPTRRVTRHEARDQQIAWSPDGSTLYFVSDREGPQSIYAATVALSRQDLEPDEPEEDDAEAETEDADDEADNGNGGDEIVNGDESEENGDDENGDKGKKEDKGPTPGDRWAKALQFTIEPVIVSEHTDRFPKPSPDGDEILFVRGRGDLMLYDLEDDELIILQEGWDEPEAAWAADGAHIVFSRMDLQFNSDLYLMNVEAVEEDPENEAAKPVNITRHPDLDVSPRLSHDGKVLYFLSDRAAPENWTYDVYAVFLDDSLEDLAGYELDEYFEEAAKAAKKLEPIEPESDDDEGDDDEDGDADDDEHYGFDTDDAYLRVRRITSIPESEGDLAITPAGDRVLFTSSPDGDRGLYSVDHRGRERKKVNNGGASSVSTSLTGDKAVFISGGQAHHAPPAGGETKALGIDAPVTIDTALERTLKFREAARTFGMMFYHPTLKGLDWPAISDRYEALALTTRTTQAMNRVLSAMFGEVDGSHTGAYGGPGYDAPNPRVGHLGIDTEPVSQWRVRGYRVTRVLRDGPADDGEDGLLVGDVITEINGVPISGGDNTLRDLRAAMIGTAGKETLFTIWRDPDGEGDAGAAETHVLLIPHSGGAETNLRYRAEVERREARVNEWSDGRIGYLHIRGMSEPQVRDYERDLYAAAHGRDGLIIDVRDNGGGWTTDILLASLTAPAHAYTVPRGADPDDAEFDSYPRGRRLIHAYQRPLTVLMNQNSYSNAEIFSHAIKTTGRGKLVGTETHGAVISTGGHTLIDGSYIRIPFRGWYLPDGTDMEHHGAVPDIDVPQLPADEAAGLDPQLKIAVEDLLRRIESGQN